MSMKLGTLKFELLPSYTRTRLFPSYIRSNYSAAVGLRDMMAEYEGGKSTEAAQGLWMG